MRIVVLSETFSKKTGYINNMLPRFFARSGEGIEVHLVTMDLPPYYQLPDHSQTYGSFADGSDLRPGTAEDYDGYRLHTVGHERRFGYMRPVGLAALLATLQPDVVQAPSAVGWLPLESALAKRRQGFQLFTGSHTTKSTFPLAQRAASWFAKDRVRCALMRGAPGRLVSRSTVKCYCPTDDCAEIAWRFFGVERSKVEVMPLGVDTDTFFPVVTREQSAARNALRERLGISDREIVCVYSGKFTNEKNPVILAEAVAGLRAAGHEFRALFIGAGVQREAIASIDGTIVIDFMPHGQLADYYRAADIGVWPTNESTSTLDAAACGLPLIVSDGIAYRAHVTGNGLTHRMNDLADLTRALRELERADVRRSMGEAGARKMATQFSWTSVAERRLADYRAAVERAS